MEFSVEDLTLTETFPDSKSPVTFCNIFQEKKCWKFGVKQTRESRQRYIDIEIKVTFQILQTEFSKHKNIYGMGVEIYNWAAILDWNTAFSALCCPRLGN